MDNQDNTVSVAVSETSPGQHDESFDDCCSTSTLKGERSGPPSPSTLVEGMATRTQDLAPRFQIPAGKARFQFYILNLF